MKLRPCKIALLLKPRSGRENKADRPADTAKESYARQSDRRRTGKLDDKGKPMELGVRAGDTVIYGNTPA